MKKVPLSEKLRKEIDEILSGRVSADEDLLGLLIERVFENGVSEDFATGSTGLFGAILLRARSGEQEGAPKWL